MFENLKSYGLYALVIGAVAGSAGIVAASPQAQTEEIVRGSFQVEGFQPGVEEEVQDQLVLAVANEPVEVQEVVADVNDTLNVSCAVTDGAGWFAVYADDEGYLGDTLGFAPLRTGVNEDVSVQIDPAQATDVMYGMLHVDSGVLGAFEFPQNDMLMMAEDGQPSWWPSAAHSSNRKTPWK